MIFSRKRKKKKMPNWCMNELQIRGPEIDVLSFMNKLKSVKEDEISIFAALIPMPKEYSLESANFEKDQDKWSDNEKLCFEKYGHKDWYSWCNAYWGVKWDASDVYVLNESYSKETNITLAYSTPWGPGSEQLAEALCEYKNLSFHLYYEESGMCFHGAVTIVEGEVVYEEQAEMNNIHTNLDDSLEYL